jgi:TonB family protein
MNCHARSSYLIVVSFVLFLISVSYTAAQDPEQYLRDHYLGKTLVLRGFYSADRIRYDSSGSPDTSEVGDWTVDGFVIAQEIHVSGDRLKIKAERLVADCSHTPFQLRPSQEGFKKKIVYLKLEADFPQHNPSPQQIDSLMSQIFLTSQDRIADLVPAYWKPCVPRGVVGQDKNCLFSPEILAVPGVAGSTQADPARSSKNQDAPRAENRLSRIGALPPKLIFQRSPEFSETARASRFQGVARLMLVVNKEGAPTDIRIVKPLGLGLDAKAVEAVQDWKFSPATKDGEPVAAEITVEVNFQLY